MNLDPESPRIRRGQLTLVRMLPGGTATCSPEAVAFPARVPRKGEALLGIGYVYALATAALVVVFPSFFCGAGFFWLIPAVPALVQMEMFTAGALHALTAPAIHGRFWFAATQLASGVLAASAPGWPRAIAISAAALMLVELAAGRLNATVARVTIQEPG